MTAARFGFSMTSFLLAISFAHLSTSIAMADFQGDALRDALQNPRSALPATESSKFQNIQPVERLDQLDLSRPLTSEHVDSIRTYLLQAFGSQSWAQDKMPQLLGSMTTLAAQPSLSNLIFYLGVEAGLVIGGAANVAIIFGIDSTTDRLAVHVAPLLRAQIFQLGYGLVMGIGSIQGPTPGISGGMMAGFAVGYGLGAGYGISAASDAPPMWWVEAKMGTVTQGGVFFEAIL